MAKAGFLYQFPEIDHPDLEFLENRKSDLNHLNCRSRLRRLALIIVLVVGAAVVIVGTLFLINESSSEDKIQQDTTNSISDGKILQSSIINVPEIGDRNNTSYGSISNLQKQWQNVTGFDQAALPDNSKNNNFVPIKSDIISSTESDSFEDFFQFDTATDTIEDSLIVLSQQGPIINVNKDCEKSSFDKEFVETLTQDQRNAVERLMKKVTSSLIEAFCHASSENYLVQWLKDKDWNVEEASRAVFNTLAWRKKEKIDELLTEDFSYFDEAFPVFLDGKDYTGRTVITFDIATVDPRKIMLAGKGDQMLRYLIRIKENCLSLSRKAQVRGENVTQVFMIVNLQGFNTKQHACNKCITSMYQYISILEEHYPFFFFKIFVINTPHEFEWLLHLATAVLPSYAIDAIEIFGMNKKEWQKAILEYVPADEIRPQFGGNKTDNEILEE